MFCFCRKLKDGRVALIPYEQAFWDEETGEGIEVR